MIESKCPAHGATINALAKEGKVLPAVITMPNGRKIEANSTLTALEWIKDNGVDRNSVTIE